MPEAKRDGREPQGRERDHAEIGRLTDVLLPALIAKLGTTRLGELDTIALDERHFAFECTLPEALASAKAGDRVYIDDGKLEARVETTAEWGLLARTTAVAKSVAGDRSHDIGRTAGRLIGSGVNMARRAKARRGQ